MVQSIDDSRVVGERYKSLSCLPAYAEAMGRQAFTKVGDGVGILKEMGRMPVGGLSFRYRKDKGGNR